MESAAGELEAWFDHLAERGARETLQTVAAAVTDLFLRSDSDVQTALETGFLEHVLEQEHLRSFFAHWNEDPRPSEAHQRALAWGESHPASRSRCAA